MLQRHASVAFDRLSKCSGLTPIMPKGSMYMMTLINLRSFPSFKTCREWTERLIEEESVLVFPGDPCFNFPGCFRIVLTVPDDKITEACERIERFCKKYFR